MPVYAAPEMKQVFAPELLVLLKGKSCFHIKSLDARLMAQHQVRSGKGIPTLQEERLGLAVTPPPDQRSGGEETVRGGAAILLQAPHFTARSSSTDDPARARRVARLVQSAVR